MKFTNVKILIIIVVVVVLLIAYRIYKKRKNMIRECKFFKSTEFDSPDVPGSGKNMQHSTLLMLCEARKIADVPFKINSGFRSKAHNKKSRYSCLHCLYQNQQKRRKDDKHNK